MIQRDLFKPELNQDKGDPSSELFALTLWRPWDQAIVHGTKRIENRPWKPWPRVIGKMIAIHAGLKYDIEGAEDMIYEEIYSPPSDKNSPKGCIVGVARVTGYVTKSDSPWFSGPFGWTLDDVVALENPVPCKGAQGLWAVHLSARLAVMDQIGRKTDDQNR